MAENPNDGAADNEKAHVSAANGNGDEVVSNLPMVVAPKLGAGEDEAVEEEVGETAATAEAPASRAHSTRFLMLAGFGRFRRRVRLVHRLGVGLGLGAVPRSGRANAERANDDDRCGAADQA